MDHIAGIVDVFKCCILTWDFLPVVLPAFLIAGAIPVFVQTRHVLRFLGYRAKPAVAYATASMSGVVLSACSCNIVPLALSIYKRGAGIGPAFAFLYAGPAINVVTLVWVFQVVGLKMGIWRALLVPMIAILTGLIMQVLFWREDAARRTELEAQVETGDTTDDGQARGSHVLALFAILVGVMILGARGVPLALKVSSMAVLGGILAVQLPRWFTREQVAEWLSETAHFLKMVLPVLIPAILVIGYLQNNKTTWNWLYQHIYPLMGENGLRQSFNAAVFGSVMYFPILTEVALTKALLKEEMVAVGPALAILLNGPGVSLPGAILLIKLFGWKKTVIYEALEIGFGTLAAYWFGTFYGQYHCPCQSGEVKTLLEDPSALFAAIVLAICLGIAWYRCLRRPRPAEAVSPDGDG